MKAAAIVLILGLTLSVLMQLLFLEQRPGFRAHLFNGRMSTGEAPRVEWAPRIFSTGLARLVHAHGHVAHWTAGWFLLSALAWFFARGSRCIGPVAVLGAGVLATFFPQVHCGTVASEGPMLFWFTLAAITRRRAGTWWPVIGLVAIPFKQTGAVLVVVAALLWLRDWRWRDALCLLGAGAGLGWFCALAGGGGVVAAVTTRSLALKSYPVDNVRHLFGAWWPAWLICGGTVLAGAMAARGPALMAILLLVGAVFFMGQMWEPRIWLEVVALSAGVLGEKGETR